MSRDAPGGADAACPGADDGRSGQFAGRQACDLEPADLQETDL